MRGAFNNNAVADGLGNNINNKGGKYNQLRPSPGKTPNHQKNPPNVIPPSIAPAGNHGGNDPDENKLVKRIVYALTFVTGVEMILHKTGGDRILEMLFRTFLGF